MYSLKLDYPLSGLVAHCVALCEVECCGLDAFDFSFVHMASFLMKCSYEGRARRLDVDSIEQQLETLNVNYGRRGASSKGVEIGEMNRRFSGVLLTQWVEDMQNELARAVRFLEQEGLLTD
ncbi:DUF6331 family protein [Thalassovita mediterranea]|uniref:DUF6331 family protein n=1 Tax=Thalassovita mediterranea TaxID=340021 RepID=UPI00351FC1E6